MVVFLFLKFLLEQFDLIIVKKHVALVVVSVILDFASVLLMVVSFPLEGFILIGKVLVPNEDLVKISLEIPLVMFDFFELLGQVQLLLGELGFKINIISSNFG